jgi:hypothetical protein
MRCSGRNHRSFCTNSAATSSGSRESGTSHQICIESPPRSEDFGSSASYSDGCMEAIGIPLPSKTEGSNGTQEMGSGALGIQGR